MGRIRTIKPDFWKHEDLSALPEATHMLAAALLNYADDEGYFNANPGLVRADTTPLREPSVPIPESLQSLAEIGYIRLGSTPDGKRYGQVVEFAKHQVVNKPKESKIKGLSIAWEGDGSNTVAVPEASDTEQGTGKGNREGEKEVIPFASQTSAGGASDNPDDLKIPIFGKCLDWLAKRTGKSAESLRPMVGKWCSRYGDEVVLRVFYQAGRASPVDPLGWMEKALANEKSRQGLSDEEVERRIFEDVG